MAKVPFSKLKCKIDDSVKEVKLTDDITIEVKQYLPIEEKLGLISAAIMAAHMADENYQNPVKIKVFSELEIVFVYTNLNFTDKQKEDLPKLYDMLYSSGILEKIISAIPETEYNIIKNGIELSSEAIYKYQNSIMGLMENLKEDYQNVNFDMKNIQEIMESTDLSMLKEVINKLG